MKPVKIMHEKILIFALGLLSLFSSEPAQAQWCSNQGWQMGPGMMSKWGMGLFGSVFMIIFWILILVGLVFLIKWLIQSTNRRQKGAEVGNRALEILKERYARGEIDKAEFETMKTDLSN